MTKLHPPRWGTKDGGQPAGATPPTPPAKPNEVELPEVIKGVTDGVQKIIDESLKKAGIDGKTITPEQVTQAVADALKAQRDADTKAAEAAKAAQQPNDSKALTAEQITAAVEAAVEAVLSGPNVRKADKMAFGDHSGEIETPNRLVKGNLSLAHKQLFNVIRYGEKDINRDISESQLAEGEKKFDMHYSRLSTKALTSTTGGSGDEWVGTTLSGELLRVFYLESQLAQVLLAREIQMPTNPYVYPLQTTPPTFYLEATENTAATGSSQGTSNTTLTAKKCMGLVEISAEADEDAIIAVIPNTIQALGEAAGSTYESMIINGDDTTTHFDTDTQTIAKAPERAWKGFRRLATTASLISSFASGGITASNIKGLIKMMGKYGVNPNNLIMVCGVKGQWDIMGATESLTVDKAGSAATYLTGGLPRPFGVRALITSAACREDLNASGIYDDSTKTKGSLLVFNINEFYFGRRRDFTIKRDEVIASDKYQIVASFRRAFTPKQTPAAAVQSVVMAYNYDA